MNKVRLRDVCFVKGGKRLPKGYRTTEIDTGYRYLRLIDFGERYLQKDTIQFIEEEVYLRLKNYQINAGDVCISVVGTIGIIGIVPDSLDGAILTENANKLIIRDSKKINNEYLYYFLKSKNGMRWISKGIVGSVQPKLPIYNIENIEIPLPPLHEQQKIASVLSALDDQIELNNKINQALEDFAQTLYNYWFVQFEFPNEEGKPYKSSGGKMVWNEELKREIPEGWEVKRLGEEFSIKSGYAFSSEYYDTNGKYALVTIKNVNNGVVDNKTDNFIHSIPKKLPEYCKLEPHDILITLTGNVGRLGIVANENLLLNQRVGLIECRESFMNNFAYLLFNSDKIKYEIQNLAVGTSQKNLSPLAIEKVVNLFPSKKTLIDFQIKTESLFNEIISNRQQNQELTQLRDYLLPLLMNGQVTISDELFQE